jgi:hypothetical protein
MFLKTLVGRPLLPEKARIAPRLAAFREGLRSPTNGVQIG